MNTAPSNAHGSHVQGMLLMCVGVACLSANDAIAKALTDGYSPLQILFLRNVIALPFTIGIALLMGGRAALRSHRPAAHLLRGALWVGAALMFFTSFIYLPLAEATALIFVAPFFITVISALFLGEDVGWRRWMAVLVGFLGVLLIIRPGGAAFQVISLLPVATALVYALLMLSARWVDKRESVWTLLVYLTGAGALLSALIVPFVWVPVRAGDLWLFAGIAIFGTAGMTMMTQAFRLAPAVVVAPLDYTGLLWATLFGWLIWRESLDLITVFGATIIIASGVVTILREHRTAS
ncbi:drug/metabolite transporter (DMT)-like permease [Sagittula marina]|uniref:Drug/metabolite transporter (DMT)-like permease n=1 Tax=Sagittula marina TaxID=943940 RepID=A0A7W6GRB4_9RHOB|nr:DMT family transporter [Sagittula marina]MBB3984512.1 drug/metabolite transporter (DMT)-like permease [Sagittula marina]